MNVTQRPNILLITSDQQHDSTLGVVNPRIKTPALDRLANEGTRFTRAYCNNPVCSPSRSSIITGLYPAWHGCWTIGVNLPEDVPTVGDLFQQHGYATTLIGKAHFQALASDPDGPGGPSIECQPIMRDLDFWRSFNGPWYGFEHIEVARNHADESHAGQHYAIWLEENGLTDWRKYFRAWPEDHSAPRRQYSWDLPEEYHYSAWTAERTIADIDRHVADGQPFFTWASFHDPHPPYLAPEPWASMYDPADMQPGRRTPGEFDGMPPHYAKTRDPDADWSEYNETRFPNHGYHFHSDEDSRLRKNMAVYYGMVSLMDHHIGRILDRLDELEIADNTLVVFSTDHGHFLGHHGLVAKAGFTYEDLLRVPFLARFPGRVPGGGVNDSLQGLIDLPETFLTAAGIPVPGLMQGVNQLDVWSGKQESARDDVIVEYRHQPTAVHMRTLVTERYKLTIHRDRPWGELFDLAEDPEELHNRFDDPAWAAIKAEMLHRFVNAEIAREPMRRPRIAGA